MTAQSGAGYFLLFGIAFLTFLFFRSLATGRSEFQVGASWTLKADRALAPGRYWAYVAANGAVAILGVFWLGPIAFRMAGL